MFPFPSGPKLSQRLSLQPHLAIILFSYSRNTEVLLMPHVRVLSCLETLYMLLPLLLFAWLMSTHPSDFSSTLPQEAFLDPLPTLRLGHVPPMCPHSTGYFPSCSMRHTVPSDLSSFPAKLEVLWLAHQHVLSPKRSTWKGVVTDKSVLSGS